MARMRKLYAASQNLKIIKFAEETNNSQAARSFGCDKSNIRLWRKNKAKIIELLRSKKADRGSKAKYPAMERH